MSPRAFTTIAIAGALGVLLGAPPAAADVVLDWNVTLFATLSGQGPFATTRFAAITQLAVFEAVNAITRDYEPYLGTITAPAGASEEAAAAVAAHDVLAAYFPAKAPALDAALAVSLAAVPEGPAKIDGIATGRAAAAAMIALRAGDGSAVATFYLPASSEPGQWQLTPSCPPAGGVFYHWRNVQPFGVPNIQAFRLKPPPKLGSGEYARAYLEVQLVGAVDSVSRPQDRSDVALFYAAFSPAAWANSAARQVAATRGASLSENARALALINMAMSDGTVAAFDTKYAYGFWRPVTAIHAGDTDGNRRTDPDLMFAPFVPTPCFPGYPSNHASVSYAAGEILESLYGPYGHEITFTNAAVPGVVLHYARFRDILDDVDDARVFGGIHFRFDQKAGAEQGRAIGAWVYKQNLGTRRVPSSSPGR